MNRQRLTVLSKRDLLELMEIAGKSLFCKDILGLRDLFKQINGLMTANSVCCAYGDLRKAVSQKSPDVEILNISYPDDYLSYYLGNGFHLSDPVISEYMATFQPVNWSKNNFTGKKNLKYTEIVDAEPFGMKGGWTYGTISPATCEASIFFMAGEMQDSSERTKAVVEYIVPFLSEACKRILKKNNQLSDRKYGITSSEIEILNWLKEGKTSWEISVILNKSERVVNFHINNIIKKLNAMNRTHAIVIALKSNLISL